MNDHRAEVEPVVLDRSGAALLERARTAAGGHASELLIGGDHQRVVLMALTAGSRLSEHEAPPAANRAPDRRRAPSARRARDR